MDNESLATNKERPETTRPVRELIPPVDIYENDEHLLLLADVPGVAPEGLQIDLDPPELRITARPANQPEDAPAYQYARSFTLGDTIDADGIAAELKNGVLSVTLRKSSAQRPRRIEVKTG